MNLQQLAKREASRSQIRREVCEVTGHDDVLDPKPFTGPGDIVVMEVRCRRCKRGLPFMRIAEPVR